MIVAWQVWQTKSASFQITRLIANLQHSCGNSRLLPGTRPPRHFLKFLLRLLFWTTQRFKTMLRYGSSKLLSIPLRRSFFINFKHRFLTLTTLPCWSGPGRPPFWGVMKVPVSLSSILGSKRTVLNYLTILFS